MNPQILFIFLSSHTIESSVYTSFLLPLATKIKLLFFFLYMCVKKKKVDSGKSPTVFSPVLPHVNCSLTHPHWPSLEN